MGEAAEKVISLPQALTGRMLGTDELNICEFPLATSGRDKGVSSNTLVFADRIFDEGAQKYVERKLIVTASEAFGLPTPADNDVLLVLMYLTLEKNNFNERVVTFTRYELVKLLGWDQGGRSYRRIDEALQRWVNVTLNYKRSWWSKNDQSWQTKSFHVLESIDLRGRGSDGGDCESTFTWNQVIFNSVQASHVKRLDLEMYFRLTSPAARQAYRFLDKRFYRTRVLEFDLRAFACEHIGLSRNYDIGKLKEKLRPCLCELEEIGFLQVASPADRFIKQKKGEWRIRLARANSNSVKRDEQPEAREAEGDDLVAELVSRGVSQGVAKELVATHVEEKIREKIRYSDWLKGRGKEAPKNPAGFLATAIREDYRVPAFDKQKSAAKASPLRFEKPAPRCEGKSETPSDTEALDPYRTYFDSLPIAERDEVESRALASGNPFKVQTYQRLHEKRDPLWEGVRWDLIRSYLVSKGAPS